MADPSYLGGLADAVLALHAALAAFVVGGLVIIPVGHWRGWRWVTGWWFRVAHLAAIAVIAAESWLGVDCPLTTLEAWLRLRAGEPAHPGSFIGYWLQRLLFWDAPAWAFVAAYSLFGMAVAAAWWYFPPRARHDT